MNKIKFNHNDKSFAKALGLTEKEIKELSTTISTCVNSIEEYDVCMSRVIEEIIKQNPFILKAQHYIYIGVTIEKSYTLMDQDRMLSEIKDFVKQIESEMKLTEKIDTSKEHIKN